VSELNATRGAVIALFLGEQQVTGWAPYQDHGWMPVLGPVAVFATHIHVRDHLGQVTRIPLPDEAADGERTVPTVERPYLVVPGFVCDLHWPEALESAHIA
jgi:hypothetical protein